MFSMGAFCGSNHVKISLPGRQQVQQELHMEHYSKSRMKSLAHRIACWPGMDNDVEAVVDQFKAN